MLVERKEMQDDETKENYVEAVYDSTHLLKTLYIPERKMLFVFFERGSVYSYSNVDQETYDGLEKAESQGSYFNKNVKKNESCNYYKMYTLYEFEIKDIKALIDDKKKLLSESEN